jgi:hypothetical protein
MYKVNINLVYTHPESLCSTITDAKNWCKEQIGRQVNPETKKYQWMVRDMWRVNEKNFRFERYAVFYFEKQEHANWFILRWS